jgi:hypothetical protein
MYRALAIRGSWFVFAKHTDGRQDGIIQFQVAQTLCSYAVVFMAGHDTLQNALDVQFRVDYDT